MDNSLYIILAFIAGSGLIEVSPIKINPWSSLLKFIKNALFGDILKQLTSINSRVENIEKTMAEKDAINTRTKIIRFGDELLNGVKHTKDHFDSVLLDITSYEKYCKEHSEFANDVMLITIERIKNVYMDLIKTNGFL